MRPAAASPSAPERPQQTASPSAPQRPQQTELRLEVGEPKAREYRAATKPPRDGFQIQLWVSRITSAGAFVTVGILIYIVLFTNPSRSENVLALLATLGFAMLFSAWSLGFWLRAGRRHSRGRMSTWPVTRQAVLIATGVTALAMMAINRTANAGAVMLVIVVIVAAELVMRRMRLPQ